MQKKHKLPLTFAFSDILITFSSGINKFRIYYLILNQVISLSVY